MLRLIFTCFVGAMLAACATQSSDADKNTLARDRLACADVGIDPGSPIFGQCVADLHQSIWMVRHVDPNF
jgi:hypothetical protein